MVMNPPGLDEISAKIMSLVEEQVDIKQPLRPDAPLMKELGFDSLDLIETSFTLQEFFGFEFSDKNAIEELEEVLGDGSIIKDHQITALGREMIFRRMPELKKVALPEELNPMELQQFYTIETFARLIREFYLHAPDQCPATGEAVAVEGFKIVSAQSRQPVEAPTGDALITAWAEKTAADLRKNAPPA